VRKSRNIQDLGGALTIIADHRENSDPEKVIMMDDGTGTSIAIPTIMISKEDGKRLKDAIQRTEKENAKPGAKKEYVVLLVDFEIVNYLLQLIEQTR
jgi:hypothetical protein